MANETKTTTEMTDALSTSSIATALTKIFGHKLRPEEVAHLKDRLSGNAADENREDLFADHALLDKAWDFKIQAPDIAEVIKHVQTACRGFIPTGDGVIDEALTRIMGDLIDLDQSVAGRLATAQDWQQLYTILQQTSVITQDIDQAPRVNQSTYEQARTQIMQALALFEPIKPKPSASVETKIAVAEETTGPKLT